MNLECNEVVELLPDRKAETLSSWLQQHLGVQIIARDRASAYAEGARDGAPAAVQVADRWHMLRSLGGAVRQAVERYQGVARQVASEITVAPRAADVSSDAAAEPLVTVARRRPRRLARQSGRRTSPKRNGWHVIKWPLNSGRMWAFKTPHFVSD